MNIPVWLFVVFCVLSVLAVFETLLFLIAWLLLSTPRKNKDLISKQEEKVKHNIDFGIY